MDATNCVAYLDEYGDTGLNITLAGASSHYIIAAVIIKNENKLEVSKYLELVRKKYFQTGEIKSSTIGKRDDLRLKILDEMLTLPFKIVLLVCDKKKLVTEGYKHKKSFIKNIHRKLYQKLMRCFPNIQIKADQHGSEKFMSEFANYIESRHPKTLFNLSGFEFINSNDCIEVQLADFIVGTVAREFDTKKSINSQQIFFNKIDNSGHLIGIEHFPPKSYKIENSAIIYSSDFNNEIAECALLSINNHLNIHGSSKEESTRARCELLNFMIFKFYYSETNNYISTTKLIAHLSKELDLNYSEQVFRSQIIGKLRDSGVLIASSKTGYKIPISQLDLDSYIKHQHHIIAPMINRIQNCHGLIKLATFGKIDILNDPNYQYLQKLIDYRNGPSKSETD